MKLIFQLIIIFSLVSFGQKNLFSEPTIPSTAGSTESAHEHDHEFSESIRIIFLGLSQHVYVHEHEHDHGEDSENEPWNAHNHDSRSHAHHDNSSMKVDFLSNKNLFELRCLQQSSSGERKNRMHLFEYNSEIFRPPIAA